MARNVEVKVRVDDLEGIRARALALGAADGGLLRQVDTYFAIPAERGGRLKLREHRDGRAELIAYRRPDIPGLRASHFHLVAVADPTPLGQALAHALGVVRKVA